MLVCYARELKEGFVNYVEETTKLMVPLLRFYFHEGKPMKILRIKLRKHLFVFQVFVQLLLNHYHYYSIVQNYVEMIMFDKCGNI